VPPSPAPVPAPSPLLARLDALTNLVHRCQGLLLAPDGKLTRTDGAAVAHAIGIEPDRAHGAAEHQWWSPTAERRSCGEPNPPADVLVAAGSPGLPPGTVRPDEVLDPL